MDDVGEQDRHLVVHALANLAESQDTTVATERWVQCSHIPHLALEQNLPVGAMDLDQRFRQHRLDHAVRCPKASRVLPERRALLALMLHRDLNLVAVDQVLVLVSTLRDVRRLHAVEPNTDAALSDPLGVLNRHRPPSTFRCAEFAVRIELRCRVPDDQHLELLAALRQVRTRLERRFRSVRRLVDHHHDSLRVDTLDVRDSLRRVALCNGNGADGMPVVTLGRLQRHLGVHHVAGIPRSLAVQLLKVGPHTLADHLRRGRCQHNRAARRLCNPPQHREKRCAEGLSRSTTSSPANEVVFAKRLDLVLQPRVPRQFWPEHLGRFSGVRVGSKAAFLRCKPIAEAVEFQFEVWNLDREFQPVLMLDQLRCLNLVSNLF